MSDLWKLDRKDLINGAVFAVIGAVLTGTLDALMVMQSGGVFTINQLKVIGIAGAIAFVSYLLKRFTSGNTGVILSNTPTE